MRKRICPTRALGTLTLGLWAGLFWFVLLTGRSQLYLSPRTDWLVPVGAVILSVAVVGRMLSMRAPHPESISAREAFAFAVIAIPVVIVIALPPTALGSFAAGKRSALAGASFGASADDIATGRLTLVEVAGAQRSPEAMQALVARAGEEVTFVGFVNRRAGMPADEFLLTRFLISCCVADALSVQARVVSAPPGRFQDDDWVRATGKIYPVGEEVIVIASEVEEIERPKRPYLSP